MKHIQYLLVKNIASGISAWVEMLDYTHCCIALEILQASLFSSAKWEYYN